jgi:hypothetical protein
MSTHAIGRRSLGLPLFHGPHLDGAVMACVRANGSRKTTS